MHLAVHMTQKAQVRISWIDRNSIILFYPCWESTYISERLSIYMIEIYHLVMGKKRLINIYSDHYALRPLMYLFPAGRFLLEYTLPVLKDRNCFQQLKGAVSCKELLHSLRGGGKSLILDFRSKTQWLTWFWWKLWAWMTSLKKEHGIREKAICFKTVIWSRWFSACSALVPGQDSFLSPKMLLFLVSF